MNEREPASVTVLVMAPGLGSDLSYVGDNLRRYLDGEPLLNLVDRRRGY